FGAIWASSLPSLTIPSTSVATTSRLTSPGTIEQISSTSGRNGRFSLAMSEGFVVQPSTTPIATPSRSSLTFAVSRKIFIVRLLRRLGSELGSDVEGDPVSPGLGRRRDGQRRPDGRRRPRAVERRLRARRAGRDPDPPRRLAHLGRLQPR